MTKAEYPPEYLPFDGMDFSIFDRALTTEGLFESKYGIDAEELRKKLAPGFALVLTEPEYVGTIPKCGVRKCDCRNGMQIVIGGPSRPCPYCGPTYK